MKRRHLFDKGYPVATATLIAGSEVLLAIGRQAARTSRLRLGVSCLLLADAVARVAQSRRTCMYTRLLTHESTTHVDRRVAAGAEGEPGARAPSPAAHQP
jgi:hypothetical protein